MSHKAPRLAGQLSGGQRQRVALARPSCTDPGGCSLTNPQGVSTSTTPSR